jgi:hypothetical protein
MGICELTGGVNFLLRSRGNRGSPIKGSISAALVMLVFLATAIRDAVTETQRTSARILTGCLVIGMFGTVADVARGIAGGLKFSPPPLERVLHVDEIRPKTAAAQLFADRSGFFWRVLAKPSDG